MKGPPPAGVLEAFGVPAWADCRPYGEGHINDTFAVAGLMVQRLNGSVFAEPEKVMENIVNVTGHLRGKAEARDPAGAGRRALTVVRAQDGRPFAYDADGRLWRCYVFIAGAHGRRTAGTPAQAYEAAKAYGAFQRDMADYGGPGLHETVPGFHDTRGRMSALLAAIREDAAGRAASAGAEIDFALSREGLCGVLLDLRDRGLVRERIAHNDAKLDNVLLDDATGEGICVVDLDTVMPGLCLYDFGDLVRSAAGAAAEDERDLSGAAVRPAVFEALARGYLEGSGWALTAAERENMAAAGKLLTFECGVRFLADHLAGDRYFGAARESHNLDRCRAQFALLRSLEAEEGRLTDCAMGLRPGRAPGAGP